MALNSRREQRNKNYCPDFNARRRIFFCQPKASSARSCKRFFYGNLNILTFLGGTPLLYKRAKLDLRLTN